MTYDKPLTETGAALEVKLNEASDTYEEIIKESSYLMYGFDDVVNTYINNNNIYTEAVDPLFAHNVVNSRANQKFIESVMEEVPLYYRAPELEIILDGDVVSRTRDSSILNVPTSLQNEFWYRWFSNAWGDVYNNFLLYTYNTLRYPFINENQYLNAYKLPEIASEGFKRTESEYLPDSEIRFRYTATQNAEDLAVPYMQGCQDYLEDIVLAKINAAYGILDYRPNQSLLLTSWANSLYESSLLSYDDIDREHLVFKLQDIQYELLKRKFAGSSTLYKLVMSSIARTGSLTSLTSAGWVDESHSFYDKRLVSFPYMPGITSHASDIDTQTDPFTFFKSLGTIPDGIVAPLYYASSRNYNSDAFYGGNINERFKYLRDSSSVINVNAPYSVVSVNQKIEKYETLDLTYFPEGTSPNPETLYLDKNEHIKEYAPSLESVLQLDTSTVVTSTSYQSQIAVNLTANKLLFHKNTLQSQKGQDYDYVISPTAGDHSVSLMDLPWVDYIRVTSAQKSRVQDNTVTGVQVSRLVDLPDKQLAEHYFFTVSYNTSDNSETSQGYDKFEDPNSIKYAYLWYCTLTYTCEVADDDSDYFRINGIQKSLLSKITITPDTALKSSSQIARDLEHHSVGVVPFTYEGLTSREINDYKLEINDDLSLNDSLSLSRWGTAFFFFSSYDLANRSFINLVLSSRDAGNSGVDPSTVDPTQNTLSSLTPFISAKPLADTRNIFFAVKKQTSPSDLHYEWSDPIKVLPYDVLDVSEGDTFNPDWYDLVYYLSPELNYSSASASILRSKTPLINAFGGVEDSWGLCNLARERNNDIYCNDTGKNGADPRSFYLNRVTSTFVQDGDHVNYLYEDVIPDYANYSRCVTILGDNRYDAHDKIDGKEVSAENETSVYSDEFNHYCLSVQGKEEPGEVPNQLVLANKLGTTSAVALEKATFLFNFSASAQNDNKKHIILKSGSLELSYTLQVENNQPVSAIITCATDDEDVEFKVSQRLLLLNNTHLLNNIRIALVANGIDSFIRINDSSMSIHFAFSGPIYIFGSLSENLTQKDYMLGNIYDLRVYQRALSNSELSFLFYGSLRELYTYSPSSYKLAYWTSRDLSAIRQVLPIADKVTQIKQIRAFSRSVWDSIQLDTCPRLRREADSSNQDFYNEHFADPEDEKEYSGINLAEGVEVYNNLSGDTLLIEAGESVNLKYNNQEYAVEKNSSDSITLATAMLRPTEYSDAAFRSGVRTTGSKTSTGDYKISTAADAPIKFPVADLALDTLKYSADLTPVFSLGTWRDFTAFHSRGSNIEIVYDKDTNAAALTLQREDVVGSRSNNIITSFILPNQESSNYSTFYLDRMKLKNVHLNSALSAFLNANNYYNEVRLPLAILNGSNPEYVNKWDAVRTLKEGTYYFTCKYPLQILPFSDYDLSTSSSNYATLYASTRFKITVTGRAIPYNESDYKIADYPAAYDSSSLERTLLDGNTVYIPNDNRTFPHRVFDIDLYVMDCNDVAGLVDLSGHENYSFVWKKLASNNPTDGEILLDKDAVSSSLYLRDTEIPLFFSKNYLMPFFIAKYNKASEEIDSLSADDDLIDPINVSKSLSGIASEKLTVERESDLDNLYLCSGKTYRLLFDYTGKLTELSFTDTIPDPAEETKGYARLVNLLERSTVSPPDYLYSGTCDWYVTTDPNILTKNSGFETTSGAYTGKGVDVSDSHVFYFGDPYARSSAANYLLDKNKDHRDAINNLAYFPYRAHLPSGATQTVTGAYYSCVWSVSTTKNAHTIGYSDVSEAAVLRRVWETVKNRVNAAVNTLSDNPLGLFPSLQKFSLPVRYLAHESELDSTLINSAFGLYGYKAADRVLKIRNDKVNISRRGVYTNNLFLSQDFSNNLYWKTSIYGSYVSDIGPSGDRKDVMSYVIPSNSALRLEYNTGDAALKDTIEAAISVNGAVSSVGLDFIRRGSVIRTVSLECLEPDPLKAWQLYEAETPSDLLKDFDTVCFVFHNDTDIARTIKITKAVLRRSTAVQHILGLSEVYYDQGLPGERASLIMNAHNMVVFGKDEKTLYPVEFSAITTETSRITLARPNNNTTAFITTHMLSDLDISQLDSGSLVELMRPWVRRAYLDKASEEVNCRFFAYERYIDESRKITAKVSFKKSSDVFYLGEDSSTTFTPQGISIQNCYLNSSLGMLARYNMILPFAENLGSPITVTKETFSGISGAFDNAAVAAKEPSLQCVTNIQYIGDIDTSGSGLEKNQVLYELEYAPIIYDETNSHLTTYFIAIKRYSK